MSDTTFDSILDAFNYTYYKSDFPDIWIPGKMQRCPFNNEHMNIFILDENPVKCAEYHCDKHVVKMLLESAQMLCTVSWIYGLSAPYRPTHQKHPCTLWVSTSLGNWNWLVSLCDALNEEFKYRFSHIHNHKSYDVIKELVTPEFPKLRQTPFAQAMPLQYREKGNAVLAYRRFYLAEKKHFCSWTKRTPPEWFR